MVSRISTILIFFFFFFVFIQFYTEKMHIVLNCLFSHVLFFMKILFKMVTPLEYNYAQGRLT